MDATALPNRVGRMLQRARRMARRWTLGPDAKTQIARWQAVEAHGAALEALLQRPEWAAMEERKAVAQRLRDMVMRTPTATDATRQQASIEWNMLEEFFREVRLAVREGHQARQALSKVQEQNQTKL